MRILCIYTGGTIGMVPSKKGWTPQAGFLESRVRAHIKTMTQAVQLDWIEYDPLLDSSQLSAEHWQRVANDVFMRHEHYDGILVLHGTDTMSYTSSALSFVLQGITTKVVITGAQIPVWEGHTDGLNNVECAIHAISDLAHPGVYLAFNNQVFHGSHVTKQTTEDLSAFTAPFGFTDQASDIMQGPANLLPIENIDIPIVSFHPGMSHRFIKQILRLRPQAMILRSFGHGNGPDNPALYEAIADAVQDGCVVVNMSQCFKANVDMSLYAAGGAFARSGAISAGTMTLEACVTKLMMLCSLYDTPDSIRREFLSPWAQELPLQDFAT